MTDPIHPPPQDFSWHLWDPYSPPTIFGYYHILFAGGDSGRAEYRGKGEWWQPWLGHIEPLLWREETDQPLLPPSPLAEALRRS